MGCWNKTCALTNLPIYSGDRVITFAIVESPISDNSHCYNNYAWELVPVPLYGEYDDYGWMDLDEGQDHKLVLLDTFFKNRLVRIKPYDEGLADHEAKLARSQNAEEGREDGYIRLDMGEPRSFIRYHALKDSPFESNEALGNQMHGLVFGIKDDYNVSKVSELSHVMIKEDAFNSLKECIYHSESEGTSSQPEDYIIEVLNAYKDYVLRGEEEFNAHIESITDATLKESLIFKRKWLDRDDASLTGFVNSELPDLRKARGFKVDYDWYALDNSVLKFLHGYRGGEDGFLTSSVLKSVKSELTNKEIIDVFAMIVMYRRLRKTYHPQSGEGSQAGLNVFTEKFPFAYLESTLNSESKYDQYHEEDSGDPDNFFSQLNSAREDVTTAMQTLKDALSKLRELRSKI